MLSFNILDTIFPALAPFRQQKSFQTQPQHCFVSEQHDGVSLLNESTV